MSEVTPFIQIIEQYPCLYNHTLPEYSKKDITEKAWKEVAIEMEWTVVECKEKWKNIRNAFVRSLKAIPSGSRAKQKKPYYLHDIMQFLLPFVKPVIHAQDSGNHPPLSVTETSQEVKEQDETGTEIDVMEEPFLLTLKEDPESRRYRKRLKPYANEIDKLFVEYLQQKAKNSLTDDHRKMFLISLLPDVNKLSDTEMREFKLKVLTLLDEILSRSKHEHDV
ncbi:uncharacterized protein LOC122400747 [Colletes gigas]|uniref:uncharacterized protein LOC122400747 n=1 Tax=Colletes gigas TaxID=935657 RepID=UPI001C9AA248|nr:uncharacterized protein LOC122400747 [Colletes gigas]